MLHIFSYCAESSFRNFHQSYFGILGAFYYHIYVNRLFFPFSFAAGSTLLAAMTAYVCSTNSCSCMSERIKDMPTYKDGYISRPTLQRSCCDNEASHCDKDFSETILLPFKDTNTASIVNACFSFFSTDIEGSSSNDIFLVDCIYYATTAVSQLLLRQVCNLSLFCSFLY